MGTSQSPSSSEDDDNDDDGNNNNTALPPYPSRECLPLGIDADDVAALISSIDSSQMRVPQSCPGSGLPHLPAEILLHVLDYIPVDYVWDWRGVCRGFRDAIQGRVLYDCLQRTELIAYLGPHRGNRSHLSEEGYEGISIMRMQLHHTESASAEADGAGSAKQRGVRWMDDYAVFRNEDGWCQRLDELQEKSEWPHISLNDFVMDMMEPWAIDRKPYGTMRWCFRLDATVLDVGFPIEEIIQVLGVDWTNATTALPWKHLLLEFLRTATTVRKLMTDKAALPAFTFSLREDCLRAVRRQRLRSTLDKRDEEDRKTLWAMNLLRPLFGETRYNEASPPWDEIEKAEDEALNILFMLQREASIDPIELARVQQLASDRTAMGDQFELLNNAFETWKSNLFDTPWANRRTPWVSFHLNDLMSCLAKNPLAWDEKTVEREGQRVERWKLHKKMIEQMLTLLQASNEAL